MYKLNPGLSYFHVIKTTVLCRKYVPLIIQYLGIEIQPGTNGGAMHGCRTVVWSCGIHIWQLINVVGTHNFSFYLLIQSFHLVLFLLIKFLWSDSLYLESNFNSYVYYLQTQIIIKKYMKYTIKVHLFDFKISNTLI